MNIPYVIYTSTRNDYLLLKVPYSYRLNAHHSTCLNAELIRELSDVKIEPKRMDVVKKIAFEIISPLIEKIYHEEWTTEEDGFRSEFDKLNFTEYVNCADYVIEKGILEI